MKSLDTEALRLRGKAWLIAHGHSEKRFSAAAVDVAWFHSLADEASVALAGDRLVPEQCGCEQVTHGSLCPVHCCQTPWQPSAPFMAIMRRAIWRNYHASMPVSISEFVVTKTAG